MNMKCYTLKPWTWFIVVGFLALAASELFYSSTGKGNAASGAAWYSEGARPTSGVVTAGRANGGQTATSDAKNYAKGMSKAFHEAASKVLPSVVMITNTPAIG